MEQNILFFGKVRGSSMYAGAKGWGSAASEKYIEFYAQRKCEFDRRDGSGILYL